ncbi:Metallophosphoesterase domain-containing protein [Trichoderma simmonsii]|uniref:Metallophosphoesterase domain-containing protein n=1 Tax=Trichoderma simmonsii TaxID=1491479 RepID=A0A8G0LPI6_9HYPO|nr:Metallophosphoesterase domain-containing protein [Trichoderma simmonsii]
MATKERIPACRIRTRCLIISDTHGMQLPVDIHTPVDVAIHCGDLTQHSRLDEFQSAIELIEKLNAPLKIVIAGNHDFSLDIPVFKQKILEANRLSLEPLDNVTIRKEYGDYGTARQMLQESRKKGIIFVDEGSHRFSLQNGALLSIYASPYTPSTASSSGWGFQYSGIHNFEIENGIDIVVTHGPPQGIMDLSAERKRIGCPQLFAAVAKAQPRIHCFGHAHDGWGAKMVAWRPQISDMPSHFTDIDNDKSYVIENMISLNGSKFESAEEMKVREDRMNGCKERGYCEQEWTDYNTRGMTLFVNAAVSGNNGSNQLPWVVDIELPLNS